MPRKPAYRRLLAPPYKSGTHRAALIVAGQEQESVYHLHVPAEIELTAPHPLVVLSPQPGLSGRETLKRSGWEALANRIGFLVAVPEREESVSADFLTALLEEIGKVFRLESARLFFVGKRPVPITAFAAAAVSENSSAASAVAPEAASPNTALLSNDEAKPAEAIWTFFDSHPRLTQKPVPTRLLVVISGIRNDKGQIALSLYRGGDGFPDDPVKAHETALVSAAPGKVIVAFERLSPGEYGIALLHDEDGDGKLTTSFGFPLEGFGVSNNPSVRFASPMFAAARFYLSGESSERRVYIRVTYLR